MKMSELWLTGLVIALAVSLGIARAKNAELRDEVVSCIAQIDSITAERQVQITGMDSMIVKLRQPYVGSSKR